jgi:hypothetical protein
MSFDKEQMKRDRCEGLALAHKNGIEIIPNHSPELGWSMPEGFTSESLIRFLKRKKHKKGIDRLKALAKIINHPGLCFCDYNGEDIVKWVLSDQKNRDIYTEGIFYETSVVSECIEQCEWFIQYIPVYLNYIGKEEDTELNEYCKKEYPELYQKVICWWNTKGCAEDSQLAWFWCKEF